MYICKDELASRAGISKRLLHVIIVDSGLIIKCGYSVEELRIIHNTMNDSNTKRYNLKQELKKLIAS